MGTFKSEGIRLGNTSCAFITDSSRQLCKSSGLSPIYAWGYRFREAPCPAPPRGEEPGLEPLLLTTTVLALLSCELKGAGRGPIPT